MHQSLLDQYHQISEEIQQENNAEMDRLISAFISDTGTESKTKSDYKQHERNMIALLALRIAVNCRLFSCGCNEKQSQLDQDITNLVENIKSNEYEWEITEDVISDSMDLLMAVCPECSDIIFSIFKLRYKVRKYGKKQTMPQPYFLFGEIAEYYEDTGRIDVEASLLEYLCRISCERNKDTLHREIVIRVVQSLTDKAPDTVCRICAENAGYFAKKADDKAISFWGLGGYAQKQTGNLSEASVYFDKFYGIQRDIYGENDWNTVIAKKELMLCHFALSRDKECEAGLYGFVEGIEKLVYDHMDLDMAEIIEGQTLYLLLMDQNDLADFEVYEKYLKIYERICQKYNDSKEPLLKLRLAYNLRAGYYMKTGDYLQAEKYFMKALDADMADGIPEMVTEAMLKSNLLTIYTVQNDVKKAVPLISELYDVMENDENDLLLSRKDKFRIYGTICVAEMQAFYEPSAEEMQLLKEAVADNCMEIFHHSSLAKECGREMVAYLLVAMLYIMSLECAGKDEYEMYLRTLRQVEREKELYYLAPNQLANLYRILAVLALTLNQDDAEAYLKQCLSYAGNKNIFMIGRAGIHQTAAVLYGRCGKYSIGKKYLEQSLEEITLVWQSCVRYLNDERLYRILSPAQQIFYSCYAIMKRQEQITVLYEKLIQFKALASLAGKERNMFLQKGYSNSNLLAEIQKLQNRIAAMASDSLFREAYGDPEEEENKLRLLESEFAIRFPDRMEFTDIRLEKVMDAMPDDSAVLEYMFYVPGYGRIQFDPIVREDEEMVIDVYILCKQNGRCSLNNFTVSEGTKIEELTLEFVEILQAESRDKAGISQMEKLEDIRAILYQKLVKPALTYIDGIKNLYIAPDLALVNLPFEILYDEDCESLEEKYSVIKIECARDFLYNNPKGRTGSGNLIIGNPEYQIKEREWEDKSLGMDDINKTHSLTRSSELAFNPLPFSESEIRHVGTRCGSRYYNGRSASKALFLSAKGYKNIHIATHGYFWENEETETIYSSGIAFSGANNWLKTGQIHELFGNGLVTADEVSRMDLHTTELVVLSSCLGARSEALGYRGFHGMVGALSAAGVHYVISHLWDASDFSTAIFMDNFYHEYMEKKQAPPVALSKTKQYMRKVTIGQLKEQGWLDIKSTDLDTESKKLLERYKNHSDHVRPFKNEIYWGGFICYQCN